MMTGPSIYCWSEW